MILKLDIKQFWDDHSWFGWYYVPELKDRNDDHPPISHLCGRWYYLGKPFCYLPLLRKGTNPPDWFMKFFKIGGYA